MPNVAAYRPLRRLNELIVGRQHFITDHFTKIDVAIFNIMLRVICFWRCCIVIIILEQCIFRSYQRIDLVHEYILIAIAIGFGAIAIVGGAQ